MARVWPGQLRGFACFYSFVDVEQRSPASHEQDSSDRSAGHLLVLCCELALCLQVFRCVPAGIELNGLVGLVWRGGSVAHAWEHMRADRHEKPFQAWWQDCGQRGSVNEPRCPQARQRSPGSAVHGCGRHGDRRGRITRQRLTARRCLSNAALLLRRLRAAGWRANGRQAARASAMPSRPERAAAGGAP